MLFLNCILKMKLGDMVLVCIVLTLQIFRKKKKEEEILYYFYNLYDMIFGKGRLSEKGQLSEPNIDLFFNESLGVSLAIVAKFCSDIHPSGSDDYSRITEQSFKMLFEDDFIDELFFNIFFGHHVKKRFV